MSTVTPFVRDPNDWLRRHSPSEWIRAAMGEVGRAEEASRARQARTFVTTAKRAAGMALNAVLLLEDKPGWGRSYVEHLAGLAGDASVPEAVRVAARTVLESAPPSNGMVTLRTKSADERVLEACRDVVAHAFAVAVRHGAMPSP